MNHDTATGSPTQISLGTSVPEMRSEIRPGRDRGSELDERDDADTEDLAGHQLVRADVREQHFDDAGRLLLDHAGEHVAAEHGDRHEQQHRAGEADQDPEPPIVVGVERRRRSAVRARGSSRSPRDRGPHRLPPRHRPGPPCADDYRRDAVVDARPATSPTAVDVDTTSISPSASSGSASAASSTGTTVTSAPWHHRLRQGGLELLRCRRIGDDTDVVASVGRRR